MLSSVKWQYWLSAVFLKLSHELEPPGELVKSHNVGSIPQSFFLSFFLKNIFIYLSGCVGSSSLTQGSNPGPLNWEWGVLATGLPGKSPEFLFFPL